MKFNQHNKKPWELTYKEVLEPAMEIHDKEEASIYLKEYVQYILETSGEDMDEVKATEIAKSNLGYWAGYYGNEVRKRVEDLFMGIHPIFGRV